MTNFEMILRTNESIRNDIIYHISKNYCFDEKGRVTTDKCTECRWYNDIHCTKRTEEWLRMAINALHNQARTGHIISVREESNAYPWDDDYIEPLYVCSECRTRLLPQWGIKYCEHCGVRFEQIKKGE